MMIKECRHCKNQVLVLHDSGAPMTCCGEEMKEVQAGVTDAAQEKHVPYVVVKGNIMEVTVGEVEHPMTEPHYITWIAVEQDNKLQIVNLTPADEPKATFIIDPDLGYTVYEYCNLHGLWKKEG